MSDVSSKFMRRLARDLDFRLEKTEKAYRVAELRVTLDRHPSVRGNYALKGGTALNVFRWDLPRLESNKVSKVVLRIDHLVELNW